MSRKNAIVPRNVREAIEFVSRYLHEIIPSPDGDPGKAILRFKDKSPSDDPILKENIGVILDFARTMGHSLDIFTRMLAERERQ